MERATVLLGSSKGTLSLDTPDPTKVEGVVGCECVWCGWCVLDCDGRGDGAESQCIAVVDFGGAIFISGS